MGSIEIPSYSEKANCVQYIFCRPFMSFIYALVMSFAMIIYGFILALFQFINCFSVVCTQKYNESYYNWIARILEWEAKFAFYAAGATKEEPEWCP